MSNHEQVWATMNCPSPFPYLCNVVQRYSVLSINRPPAKIFDVKQALQSASGHPPLASDGKAVTSARPCWKRGLAREMWSHLKWEKAMPMSTMKVCFQIAECSSLYKKKDGMNLENSTTGLFFPPYTPPMPHLIYARLFEDLSFSIHRLGGPGLFLNQDYLNSATL